MLNHRLWHYRVGSTGKCRALVEIAHLLLMISAVLLGNCKFIQQAAIAASYGLLNIAYWLILLFPSSTCET